MSGVFKTGARFAAHYLVEAMIAEGGMASIYRAFDEANQQHVAVKVLYPYYAENEVIRARFIEEGRIQRALVHPNIVRVYQIVGNPLAIIMEHVAGATLDEYLAEKGQLGEKEMLDILLPVMSALGLAHSKGIIHRDLKPSNILLNKTRQGFQPKVMDFGVAKVKDARRNLTATGTTVGTLHYMSPEQIVGSKSIDGRADIYSLGVTLYKLATGEVPFNAPTEFALMMAQVEAPPLPPSQLRPGLNPQLEAVILRAMAKKPKDRFQSVREFTTALLAIQQQLAGPRDTITELISSELLEFALSANEVARDLTGEMSFALRDELIQEAEGAEPTVEMARRLDTSPTQPATWDDSEANDSTVELSTADLHRISTLDQDPTAEANRLDAAAAGPTDVMDRSAVLDGTPEAMRGANWRVSGAQGVGSLVSESVETNSMARRIGLQSDRVVVLDSDADSRDMTAPSMRDDFVKSLAPKLPAAPSGPKVVLGYNPADTQDRTFEKPNFRTQLPRYETAKSSEDFSAQMRGAVRNAQQQQPNMPQPPPQQPPRPSTSGLMDRIDRAAQSAMKSASRPAADGEKGGVSMLWFVAIGVLVLVLAALVFFAIRLMS